LLTITSLHLDIMNRRSLPKRTLLVILFLTTPNLNRTKTVTLGQEFMIGKSHRLRRISWGLVVKLDWNRMWEKELVLIDMKWGPNLKDLFIVLVKLMHPSLKLLTRNWMTNSNSNGNTIISRTISLTVRRMGCLDLVLTMFLKIYWMPKNVGWTGNSSKWK